MTARPSVIMVPLTAADVVDAVRRAAELDLAVAVRATGHGTARPAGGAMLIATHRITAVRVDPASATAWVSAGARWRDVVGPAAAHGLTPLHGSTTGVGAVGYTLGGGMGWLARRFGLASDHVRRYDLVTPEGVELTASPTENPEVCWALGGGGAGNLGVVTGMEIDLFPVRTVYAGNLVYPAELARDVLSRWRDWTAGADERLTSSVVLTNCPPPEQVPEPLRGRSVVVVRGCWSGPVDAGVAVVDEWRRWRTPAADGFAEMPYRASDAISGHPADPIPGLATTEWFERLPDRAIEIIVNAAVPAPGRRPDLRWAEIRHAGGAIVRGAAGAPNDRGRSGEYLLEMVAVPTIPAETAWLEAHLRFTRERLMPYVTGAAYLNFTRGEERWDRAITAFSVEHRARLRAVQAALDPDRRFRHGIGV